MFDIVKWNIHPHPFQRNHGAEKKNASFQYQFPVQGTHHYWSSIYMWAKLTTIGSGNGLAPVRHQAIIWTNAGFLLITFTEIWIKIK